MSSATEGAMVFWTDDGTDPTTSSNLYSEAFRIYGTTLTIKAKAIKADKSSAVTTATFTLNDGKSPDQLGIIKGTIKIPAGQTILPSQINIFSDDLPGVLKHPDASGFFIFDGLDTTKVYNFYFTNQEVGPIIAKGIRKYAPKTLDVPGGINVVATQLASVQPAAGAGLNLGDILLKKTGKIKAKAQLYGRTGLIQSDHSGIDVYVPGTSFVGKTNSEGLVDLWFIPEGTYSLRAEKASYTFKEVQNIRVLADAETDISAEPMQVYYGYGTVTGTALLIDGSNDLLKNEGISILLKHLSDPTLTFNTVSAPDGSFTISGVEPGSYFALLSKDGFLTNQIEGISVAGAKVSNIGTISLRAIGGKLSGRAKTIDLADNSGIIIVACEKTSGKTFSTATTTNGTYVFNPLLPGTYKIIASKAGYSTQLLDGVSINSGEELNSVDFQTLGKAVGTITGTASLEGGSDFTGIAVTARKSDDATVSVSAITDKSGVYILSDLKPGTYLLQFAKDGFLAGNGTQATLISNEVAEAPRYELKTATGRLSGYAKLDGSSDHAGIAILAVKAGSEVTKSTVTDATGRFSLVGLEPGTWTVQATREGYVTALSDPILLGAGSVRDDVSMNLTVSSRTIVGKVTLEGMSVHSGTKITATSLVDTRKIYSALTNNEGYFVLAGLTPGSYLVTFSHENFKGITTSAISLASVSSVTLDDMRLDRARGKVSGIVKQEGRTSHAGAKVALVGTDYTTETAADGSYEFQVPAGNYPGGVRFQKADFETTANAETVTVLTDSTYGIPTATMKATHNSISGRIDLLNGADSGIEVRIEGLDGFSMTTGADGLWRFDHVPLGKYTVSFSKEMTPKVTTQIEVKPADSIDVGKLEMIPNASTIKGRVTLDGLSDHANILVTVTTEGKADQTATTNSSGNFEITNILSTGTHKVSFSKNGWVAQSITINDLNPLEVREIGRNGEYKLLDKTAPTLTSVVLEDGANFTNKCNIGVRIDALDAGSGIAKMAVQVNGFPSDLAWETYMPTFAKDLSSLPPQIYTGNGDYTVKVVLKDLSGNVSSSAEDKITVTNQTSILKGVLSGESLKLTKARSPYRVESNILVPEGSKLVIEPGAEIRFAGDFYLKVDGEINAVGTENEKIIFSKTDDAAATRWSGVNLGDSTKLSLTNRYTWNSGNIFKHCVFEYANTPLSAQNNGSSGGALIDHVTFASSNGNYPRISGNSVAINSDFECGAEFVNFYGIAMNNTIKKYFHESMSGGLIGMNDVKDTTLAFDSISSQQFVFNKMNNAKISISNIYGGDGSGIEFSNNSFVDCSGILVNASACSYSQAKKVNFTGNFWGTANTQELNFIGANANASFISDYYDNFEHTRVDYSNWASAPIDLAGYRGDAFMDFDFKVNGAEFDYKNNFPEPTSPNISISVTPYYSIQGISMMRVAQNLEDLDSAPWQRSNAAISYTINKNKCVDGVANIYVQVKDTAGNLSGFVRHAVPYGSPVISNFSLAEGKVFTTSDKSYTFTWNAYDAGVLQMAELRLNDMTISKESSTWGVGNCDRTYKLGLQYMATGDYTLTAKAMDSVGNTAEKSVNFSISRPVSDTWTGVSWDSGTGELKKDAGTMYLWNFANDGTEKGGDPNNTLQGLTSSLKGINHSAQNIGISNKLKPNFLENSFTIEFWKKNGSMYINKQDVLILNCSSDIYIMWYNLVGTQKNGNSSPTITSQSDAKWHHYALVFNGLSIRFYIDGVLSWYSDGFAHTLNNNDNALDLYLEYADEIRISSKARGPDEIMDYYKAAAGKIVE